MNWTLPVVAPPAGAETIHQHLSYDSDIFSYQGCIIFLTFTNNNPAKLVRGCTVLSLAALSTSLGYRCRPSSRRNVPSFLSRRGFGVVTARRIESNCNFCELALRTLGDGEIFTKTPYANTITRYVMCIYEYQVFTSRDSDPKATVGKHESLPVTHSQPCLYHVILVLFATVLRVMYIHQEWCGDC